MGIIYKNGIPYGNQPNTDHKADVIYDTASGDIASFPDGADGLPVKDLTVAIEPVQAGTGDPSPTNVRTISGWTGANVSKAGTNLFDYTDPNNWRIAESGTYRVKTSTIGSIAIQGSVVTLTRTDERAGLVIVLGKLIAGFEYTISFGSLVGTNLTVYIGKLDADVLSDNYYSTRAFTLSIVSNKVTFTPSVTGLYEILLWGTATGSISVSNVQLEFGSSASEFTPFVANETIPISWQSEAGTVYGGTLDVTSGVLTVDRAIVDLGTLDWGYVSEQNFFTTTPAGIKTPPAYDEVIASCYASYAGKSDADMATAQTGIYVGSNGKLKLKDTRYSSALDLKSALSGQSAVYPLAQPTTVTLTATEIKTLLGQNNIWSDTGAVLNCEYPCDTKLYIQKINTPTDDDMIADANIASGQYFIVNNNLYLSTAAILAGDPIKPGTNCTLTNLAEALNALNS